MFHSARLQLTTWYLLIIMVICGLFSIAIYTSIDHELGRFEHFQSFRLEQQEGDLSLILPPRLRDINAQMVKAARQRLLVTLGIIDLTILVVSGGAGYFLAGRTLKPIQNMVDEQHRFIADASHELRTPLTSLRSEIEVGLRNKKLSLEDVTLLLKSNLEEVIRLQTLSDDLLVLAQQQAPPQAAQSIIKIKECIRIAIKKLTPLAHAKHIMLHEKGVDAKILSVGSSLCELIVILLDNAVKYSPPQSTITITTRVANRTLTLRVKDAGIGIDKKNIPYIFDRFYRASKSRTKDDAPGYGLGLSIGKKIVEQHSGTIVVTSVPEKGTTFTVTLPVV